MSVRTTILLACGACFLFACEAPEATDPASGVASSTQTAGAEGETLAARVGDEEITVAEVDAWIKDDLFNRETQGGNEGKTYDVRSEALKLMVRRRALAAEAARRNTTEEALIMGEVAALGEITDEDVTKFYEERVDQMGGLSLEQVSPRIRTYLEQSRAQEVMDGILESAGITMLLERPRVEVAADGPSKGPADATVTIIEFSDFQCPFCSRALPILEEVLERYPNDVRLVYRHLPLDSIHSRARAAAEASLCANDQEQFWAYHDLLFENNRNLEDDALRGFAESVGIDVAVWSECMEQKKFASQVEADLAAARSVGLSGTPAFVVNGFVLSGARPVEDFVELIDAELESAGKKGAS